VPGLTAATGARDLSSTHTHTHTPLEKQQQQRAIQCQAHHHMTLAFVYYRGRRERLFSIPHVSAPLPASLSIVSNSCGSTGFSITGLDGPNAW